MVLLILQCVQPMKKKLNKPQMIIGNQLNQFHSQIKSIKNLKNKKSPKEMKTRINKKISIINSWKENSVFYKSKEYMYLEEKINKII